MAIYGIFFIFFILLSTVKVKGINDRTMLRVCILLLYFFATFRSITIGGDTANYYRVFNSIARTGMITGYSDRFELGYLYLNRIIAFASQNFTVFLAVINLIIYYAYYIFIKNYSNNYGMSLFLFLSLGTWGRTVNVIRLELAVSMFIYAYILYKRNKKAVAIFIGLLGVLFQRISIVYFALFFVPPKLSRKFYFWSAIFTLITFLGLDYIVGFITNHIPYFSHYISDSVYVYGEVKISIVLQLFIHMLILFVSIVIYKRNRWNNIDSIVIESQLNLTYVSSLVLFLSMKFNILDRCEAIFGAFIMLLLPNICKLMRNKTNRFITILIICIIGVAYFLVINIYRPEWNQIVPYHFIWFDK